MGARPLRRAIQRFIEDPLADFVLRAELTPGATVMVERGDGTGEDEVKLTVVQPKKVPAAVGGGGAAEESGDTEPQDEPAPPPPAADAEPS
jgi:ATP-dependent Clp protease ATP-binding subunit ClpC